MMTVHEVSALTGVSIRTLHYYDEIGLLPPTVTTEAGYRLYDDTGLARLQQIMLFKELEFPLKDIQTILNTPDFDTQKALEQQITLLTLKRERLDVLITFAKQLQKGGTIMSYRAFDKTKLKQYSEEAKKTWGNTGAYREYEEKTAGISEAQQQEDGAGLMAIFTEFGALRTGDPAGDTARALVIKLQRYISEHYYTCTKPILATLGTMYTAGDEMTENIDAAGGVGTAAFAAKAIECYCTSE